MSGNATSTNPYTAAFGVVLKRFRSELDISQTQLSWETGIDRKFISEIERGIKEPCLGTIVKLVRTLEISLSHFMQEVERQIDP